MNKYEILLDRINRRVEPSDDWTEEDWTHYKTVREALEKQIPKKAHISLHGTTDWNTKCRCPVCRHDVFGTLKYCGNCGQALDWMKN